VAIARQLGTSRTPLREALNRLTADGFLTFSPKQGFFRKPIEVNEIFDLCELRLQIEIGERNWQLCGVRTMPSPSWRSF
jgi:DNA-binding GntR family transcriptional regulator